MNRTCVQIALLTLLGIPMLSCDSREGSYGESPTVAAAESGERTPSQSRSSAAPGRSPAVT